MNKRYLSGMLIAVPNLTMVCFTKNPTIDSVIIDINYNERLLEISYPPDTYVSSINYSGIIIVHDQLLTIVGCYELLPTAVCNGIEYVQSSVPVNSIYQHIISSNKLTHSGITYRNNDVFIMITDLDLKLSLNDYLNMINSTEYMYAHVTDESLYNLVNIYYMPFDNEVYNCTDKSISGMTKEWLINDVLVSSEYINNLRKLYPEIQFYTDEQDRDQNNHNEWMKFDIKLSGVQSPLFNNHVLHDEINGDYWTTTINVEFEYSCTDLPTLLARRDSYRAGHFLNDFRYFYIKYTDIEGYDPIQCATFWNRNDLSNDYQLTTSKDNTNYSIYSYNYTGSIIYTNIQYRNLDLTPIEEIVCSIINQSIPMNPVDKLDLNKHNIKDEEYIQDIGEVPIVSTEPDVSTTILESNSINITTTDDGILL